MPQVLQLHTYQVLHGSDQAYFFTRLNDLVYMVDNSSENESYEDWEVRFILKPPLGPDYSNISQNR